MGDGTFGAEELGAICHCDEIGARWDCGNINMQ